MAKKDAPNYRKATTNKKCGNCKAWDSSKTKDPMTGYCEWYNFNCRADHTCDAWAPDNFEKAWSVIKRDVRDPIHGSVPDKTAMVGVKGTDIKPLRRQGHTQKNKVFKRKTGDPTAGSKGNKDTDATPAEKRVKAKMRRLNLVGERGEPKQNS